MRKDKNTFGILIILLLKFAAIFVGIPSSKANLHSGKPRDFGETNGITLMESAVANNDTVIGNDGYDSCTTVDTELGSTMRNGLTDKDMLWKNLSYYMEGEYSNKERELVDTAIEILRIILPIVTFQKLDKPLSEDEAHVVIIRNDVGCSSLVGRWGYQQYIELSNKCLADLRSILHEFIHVLGLIHEQNRSDRDDYVIINWENIKEGSERQFEIRDGNYFSSFGVAYNPHSIMHYSLNARSKNGKPTITLKESVEFAPNKPLTYGPSLATGLQETDVFKIRKMYGYK